MSHRSIGLSCGKINHPTVLNNSARVLLIASAIRYVGVLRLLFLIGHLQLISVCLGEDERTNTIKTHLKNKKWTLSSSFINYSTLNSEQNIGRTSVCN